MTLMFDVDGSGIDADVDVVVPVVVDDVGRRRGRRRRSKRHLLNNKNPIVGYGEKMFLNIVSELGVGGWPLV